MKNFIKKALVFFLAVSTAVMLFPQKKSVEAAEFSSNGITGTVTYAGPSGTVFAGLVIDSGKLKLSMTYYSGSNIRFGYKTVALAFHKDKSNGYLQNISSWDFELDNSTHKVAYGEESSLDTYSIPMDELVNWMLDSGYTMTDLLNPNGVTLYVSHIFTTKCRNNTSEEFHDDGIRYYNIDDMMNSDITHRDNCSRCQQSGSGWYRWRTAVKNDFKNSYDIKLNFKFGKTNYTVNQVYANADRTAYLSSPAQSTVESGTVLNGTTIEYQADATKTVSGKTYEYVGYAIGNRPSVSGYQSSSSISTPATGGTKTIWLLYKERKTAEKEYKLTINYDANAIFSVTGDGKYSAGTEVTIECQPQQNYSFSGWSGSSAIASASSAKTTLTMPANDLTITATAAKEAASDTKPTVSDGCSSQYYYYTTSGGYSIQSERSSLYMSYYGSQGIRFDTISYSTGTDAKGNVWYFIANGTKATYVHPCTYNGNYVGYVSGINNITELTFPETIQSGGVSYTVTSIGGSGSGYNSEHYNSENGYITQRQSPCGLQNYEYTYYNNNQNNKKRADVTYGVLGNGEVISYDMTTQYTPYSCQMIETNHYFYNTKLREITIPSTVTEIESGAFMYCQALEKINGGENLQTVGNDAFKGGERTEACLSIHKNTDHIIFYFNKSESAQYKTSTMTQWETQAQFASMLKFPSPTQWKNIRVLGDGAFSYRKNLRNVVLGSSLTNIEFGCFAKDEMPDIYIYNDTVSIVSNYTTLGSETMNYNVYYEAQAAAEQRKLEKAQAQKQSYLDLAAAKQASYNQTLAQGIEYFKEYIDKAILYEVNYRLQKPYFDTNGSWYWYRFNCDQDIGRRYQSNMDSLRYSYASRTYYGLPYQLDIYHYRSNYGSYYYTDFIYTDWIQTYLHDDSYTFYSSPFDYYRDGSILEDIGYYLNPYRNESLVSVAAQYANARAYSYGFYYQGNIVTPEELLAALKSGNSTFKTYYTEAVNRYTNAFKKLLDLEIATYKSQASSFDTDIWYCNSRINDYLAKAAEAAKKPDYRCKIHANIGSTSQTYVDSNFAYYVLVPLTIDVTLDGQGATEQTQTHVLATPKKTIPSVSTPKKYGYLFTGYFTQTLGRGFQLHNSAGTGIRAWDTSYDPILYANWTPITYSIAFQSNGGSGYMATQTFSYDTAQNLRANSYYRTGYTFKNWNGDIGTFSNGQQVKNITAENGKVFYLKAQWQANTYQIVYNANGGTLAKTTATVAYDGSYGSHPEPTKTGYRFDGWYDASGNKAPTGTVKITSTLNLYARWSAVDVKVSFDANGGSVYPTSRTGKYEATYGTLPLPTASRTGYSFLGWFHASSSTQVTASTKIDTWYEHTLYAHWSANSYTVSLDANGGTVSPSRITVTYDNTYNQLPTPNTRVGYDFLGWFTAKENGTKVNKTDTVKITSNATLYAHWELKELYVTFDPNGGTVSPDKKTAIYGSPYGTLPVPVKKGYSPDYWFASTGEKIVSSTVVSTVGYQTLTTRWTAKSYRINYNLNDSSGSQRAACTDTYKTVTFDSAIGTLATPTRTGYSFSGWFTSADGGSAYAAGSTRYTVDANTTIYAHWTKKTYAVTLDARGGRFDSHDSSFQYLASMNAEEFMAIYSDMTHYPKTANAVFEFDSMMTAKATPKKLGFKFAGYYTGVDGSGVQIYNENGFCVFNDKLFNAKAVTMGDGSSVSLYTVTRLYAHWVKDNSCVYYQYPTRETGSFSGDEAYRDGNTIYGTVGVNIAGTATNPIYDTTQAIPSTENVKINGKASEYMMLYALSPDAAAGSNAIFTYNIIVPYRVQYTDAATGELITSPAGTTKTITVEVGSGAFNYIISQLGFYEITGIDMAGIKGTDEAVQRHFYSIASSGVDYGFRRERDAVTNNYCYVFTFGDITIKVFEDHTSVYNANAKDALGTLYDTAYHNGYFISSNASGVPTKGTGLAENNLPFGAYGFYDTRRAYVPGTTDALLNVIANNAALRVNVSKDVITKAGEVVIGGENSTYTTDKSVALPAADNFSGLNYNLITSAYNGVYDAVYTATYRLLPSTHSDGGVYTNLANALRANASNYTPINGTVTYNVLGDTVEASCKSGSIRIHTPVASQSVDKEFSLTGVYTEFSVIPNNRGTHISAPGYGERNYISSETGKLVMAKKDSYAYNIVAFPFDVWEKATGTFYKAETPILLKTLYDASGNALSSTTFITPSCVDVTSPSHVHKYFTAAIAVNAPSTVLANNLLTMVTFGGDKVNSGIHQYVAYCSSNFKIHSSIGVDDDPSGLTSNIGKLVLSGSAMDEMKADGNDYLYMGETVNFALDTSGAFGEDRCSVDITPKYTVDGIDVDMYYDFFYDPNTRMHVPLKKADTGSYDDVIYSVNTIPSSYEFTLREALLDASHSVEENWKQTRGYGKLHLTSMARFFRDITGEIDSTLQDLLVQPGYTDTNGDGIADELQKSQARWFGEFDVPTENFLVQKGMKMGYCDTCKESHWSVDGKCMVCGNAMTITEDPFDFISNEGLLVHYYEEFLFKAGYLGYCAECGQCRWTKDGFCRYCGKPVAVNNFASDYVKTTRDRYLIVTFDVTVTDCKGNVLVQENIPTYDKDGNVFQLKYKLGTKVGDKWYISY